MEETKVTVEVEMGKKLPEELVKEMETLSD